MLRVLVHDPATHQAMVDLKVLHALVQQVRVCCVCVCVCEIASTQGASVCVCVCGSYPKLVLPSARLSAAGIQDSRIHYV